MEWLQVKNWETYQHYANRKPPWIKLYHTLLDDYEYCCLNDHSKLLLISMYLLAARTNNKIPYDTDWIQKRACLQTYPDLKELISFGFLKIIDEKDSIPTGKVENASKLLAYGASTNREEKRREEKEQNGFSNSQRVENLETPYKIIPTSRGEESPRSIFSRMGEQVNEIKQELTTFPTNSTFNPYMFAGSMLKKKLHPLAVLEAIKNIKKNNGSIENPWAYGERVCRSVHAHRCQTDPWDGEIAPNINKLINSFLNGGEPA